MLTCSSCQKKLLPGSLFCDSCGGSVQAVQVQKKLRQSNFDTIKDSKGGLLLPGERIKGRKSYIIEEAIARSGFGATFRATRLGDKKQLLIKQMIEQSSYDQFKDELFKTFKREAKFLLKMKHPAFPRGYEYFEKNKSFYLVMDFINGKDLNKAIDDYREQTAKVDEGLLLYLALEISEALEIVHQFGFIYRDLKPHNVMIDGISGRLKLIDFGTLYSPKDKKPLLFESEGYTPPEFKDTSQPFVPSGDIYSLGAMLYELFVGSTPTGPQPDLSKVSLDDRFKKIIERCLRKDPKERYQRVRDVRTDLKKLTSKGFWPFTKKASITPKELSILPKALYPSQCTFCDYCGHADAKSNLGYCEKCRIPLKVAQVTYMEGKQEREFFLNATQNVLGKSSKSEVSITLSDKIHQEHAKIFRKKQTFYLQACDASKEDTLLNHRKVIGPVELKEGDTITLGDFSLTFGFKDAC